MSNLKVFSMSELKSTNLQHESEIFELEQNFTSAMEPPFEKMVVPTLTTRNFQRLNVSQETESASFQENTLERVSSRSIDKNLEKTVATIIEARSFSKRKQKLDELFKNLSALYIPSETNLVFIDKEVLSKTVTTDLNTLRFYYLNSNLLEKEESRFRSCKAWKV